MKAVLIASSSLAFLGHALPALAQTAGAAVPTENARSTQADEAVGTLS